MAMDLLGARLVVLHDAPAVDAELLGARLVVMHNAPAVDANLLGSRLVVMHDAPVKIESWFQGESLADRPFQGVVLSSRNKFKK